MLTRKMYPSSFAPPRIGSIGPLPQLSKFTLTIDWTAYVSQTGETISTSTWAVETNTTSGAPITLSNPVLTGSVATVQCTCTAEGENVITNTVTMTNGNVEKRQWRIECLDTQP